MRLLLPPLAVVCRLGRSWLAHCRHGGGLSLFLKTVSHGSSTTGEPKLGGIEELKQQVGFIYADLILNVVGLGDDEEE